MSSVWFLILKNYSFYEVRNFPARNIEASSISAAIDQMPNNKPLNNNATVNTGKVSITENAKSGKFAAIDEKSENISDEMAKNPECERLAIRFIYPATDIPADTPNAQAEMTIFAATARRSCRLIRCKTFSVNPAGGSGAERTENSCLYLSFMG